MQTQRLEAAEAGRKDVNTWGVLFGFLLSWASFLSGVMGYV